MIELFHRLRRLCLEHHVEPSSVRITVEFLDDANQHNAEYALRRNAKAAYLDPKMVDALLSERPFKCMGVEVIVKRHCHQPVRAWHDGPGR